MLRLIIFLLFLIISVWLGIEVVRHPGYILLVYQPWMVQMPIWLALLGILVILGIFYLLITCVDQIQLLGFKFKNWLRFRRENQSYSKTQKGLSAVIEGRWKKGESLLLAGVSQTVDPLMNFLGAAKAAQEQGAIERRDIYIQKAYAAAPSADLAIGLTQAELEIEQHQFAQAAAILNHLRAANPRHPLVLKLLEKVYVHLGEWQNLINFLPSLRKAKTLNLQEIDLLEKNIYCEIFHAASDKNLEEIHRIWNEIPHHAKKNPEVTCAYVKQLIRFPDTSKEVEDLIRKTLKQSWQPDLVNIYGTLPFTNLSRQLVIVGTWLKIYGQHPELLLVLGKLCVRIQLWGKAKDYFEKCIAIKPNLEASLEYGKLLEHLGESNEALQKYREGMAMNIQQDENVKK